MYLKFICFRHTDTSFLLQTNRQFSAFSFCSQSDKGLQISCGKDAVYQGPGKLYVKRRRHQNKDCRKFS